MQDSALAPGNLLTFVNSYTRRPEMRPEAQGIAD